jgi:hypothetical protein
LACIIGILVILGLAYLAINEIIEVWFFRIGSLVVMIFLVIVYYFINSAERERRESEQGKAGNSDSV